MRPTKKQLKVAGALVLIAVVFFEAPVLPYTASTLLPNAYKSGFTSCFDNGYVTNITAVSPQVQECLNGYLYPSASVLGFATPAYGLIGYGSAPFPPQVKVTEGNYSALLFFKGSKVVAAEDTQSADVMVNPARVVEVESAPILSSDFGFINITVNVRNVGYDKIEYPTVYLSMEGYSSNTTRDGLTWIEPRPVGVCTTEWLPGDYCRVSVVTPNLLPFNKTFNYYAEVRGYDNGNYFVYRQGFEERYPTGGVGPLWVKAFLSRVNETRGGRGLTENSTLDQFAAVRFKDASEVYQISDYGFTNDTVRYFGIGATNEIQEVLLYPEIYLPSDYASFLAKDAPGHWSALIDTQYTQFGYYIGHGAYYEVSLPCVTYEIPGAGINITQFFSERGCTTSLVGGLTWLVIILSP